MSKAAPSAARAEPRWAAIELLRRLPEVLVIWVPLLLAAGHIVSFALWTIWVSFTPSTLVPVSGWVGLRNYTSVMATRNWQIAFDNLLLFGSAFVLLSVLTGLALAILLDQRIRGENVLRSIFLYPLALSFVVTGTVWSWLLNPGLGIQKFVNVLGWTSFRFDWLLDRDMAIWTIVIAAIWQSAGFAMALFLAGLRSVDADLLKAAQIDGAGPIRMYRRIILPTLWPITVTVVVIQLQFAITTFDLVRALTDGGPGLATQLPALVVYDFMFQRGLLGRGAAAAVLMLLILLAVLLPYAAWTIFPAQAVRPCVIRPFTPSRGFIYLAVWLVAAAYLMPFVVVVLNSLRTAEEIAQTSMIGWPKQWAWNNYTVAWAKFCVAQTCAGIQPYMLNSAIVTLPATILSTLLGAVAGYAISLWRFRGDRWIFGVVMLGMFLPQQMRLLPWTIVLRDLGLTNTLTGLVMIHTIQGMSFTTLFCRNYYIAIPQELIKAARIDGAGFFRIVLAHRPAAIAAHPDRHGDLAVHAHLERVPLWRDIHDRPAATRHRRADRALRLDRRHPAAWRPECRRHDCGVADFAGLYFRRAVFRARSDRRRGQVGQVQFWAIQGCRRQ